MRISARGVERREVDAVACSTLPSREAGLVNKRLITRLIMLEKTDSTITNFEDNVKCNSATLIESLKFTEKIKIRTR